MSRLFLKSKYEEEFRNSEALDIFNYNRYDIYSYISLFGVVRYTFWYSSEDSEYLSYIETIDECVRIINDVLSKK